MWVYLRDLWFSKFKAYVPIINICGLFVKGYIRRKLNTHSGYLMAMLAWKFVKTLR